MQQVYHKRAARYYYSRRKQPFNALLPVTGNIRRVGKERPEGYGKTDLKEAELFKGKYRQHRRCRNNKCAGKVGVFGKKAYALYHIGMSAKVRNAKFGVVLLL